MHRATGNGRADWQTPQWIIERVRLVIGGPIGLDPATNLRNPTGACTFYTPGDDGLSQPWAASSIFLNPPWSRTQGIRLKPWLQRARDARNNQGMWESRHMFILVAASMNSSWFHEYLDDADMYFFPRGRVSYDPATPEQSADAPGFDSVLCYWGDRMTEFRSTFESRGLVLA